jgi:microcystin-dependent protein
MIKRILMAFAVVAATSGAAQAQSQYTFIGNVLIFAGNFCPLGYMPMNGQLLPINQNIPLFSILGTMYGGNGTTNFALPNALPMKTSNGQALMQCIAVRGIFPPRN